MDGRHLNSSIVELCKRISIMSFTELYLLNFVTDLIMNYEFLIRLQE